jgi:DNA-binding NarL/FixJ family response regulator
MPTTVAKSIRVLIVEDHAVVSEGLRLLIENRAGLAVVGEAAGGADALAVAALEQPDIILLDLILGEESGLDLLPKLLKTARQARILILTGVEDPATHRRAVQLGAMGLVRKEQATEILLKAIKKVYAGEVWFDRSMMASVLGEMARERVARATDPEAAKIAMLTAREHEVIALVGKGLKNKQIANRLFISETTVRHHLTSIMDKLGVSGRIELIMYIYQHGLAEPPR